jgi:hypothetical protein
MSKLWFYGYSMFYEMRAARRLRPVAVPVDLFRLSVAMPNRPSGRVVAADLAFPRFSPFPNGGTRRVAR